MGISVGDARELNGALPEPNDRLAGKKIEAGLDRREDLRAKSRRETAADEMASASKGHWLPKISLFAQENWYHYGSFDPVVLERSGFQNAYALGLRLSWDLFDGGASIAHDAESSAKARRAAAALRAARDKQPLEFEQSRRRFLYGASLYRVRLRVADKSKESVRLANIGIRAGTKTDSELLDAELELFRARAGIVRAQLEALEALTNLELALGYPLTDG